MAATLSQQRAKDQPGSPRSRDGLQASENWQIDAPQLSKTGRVDHTALNRRNRRARSRLPISQRRMIVAPALRLKKPDRCPADDACEQVLAFCEVGPTHVIMVGWAAINCLSQEREFS